MMPIRYDNKSLFQSTLLMRGATHKSQQPYNRPNFNPRSSCEERHANANHLHSMF